MYKKFSATKKPCLVTVLTALVLFNQFIVPNAEMISSTRHSRTSTVVRYAGGACLMLIVVYCIFRGVYPSRPPSGSSDRAEVDRITAGVVSSELGSASSVATLTTSSTETSSSSTVSAPAPGVVSGTSTSDVAPVLPTSALVADASDALTPGQRKERRSRIMAVLVAAGYQPLTSEGSEGSSSSLSSSTISSSSSLSSHSAPAVVVAEGGSPSIISSASTASQVSLSSASSSSSATRSLSSTISSSSTATASSSSSAEEAIASLPIIHLNDVFDIGKTDKAKAKALYQRLDAYYGHGDFFNAEKSEYMREVIQRCETAKKDFATLTPAPDLWVSFDLDDTLRSLLPIWYYDYLKRYIKHGTINSYCGSECCLPTWNSGREVVFPVVPSVKELCDYCVSKGINIGIITNNQEKYRAEIEGWLKSVGIILSPSVRLIMKSDALYNEHKKRKDRVTLNAQWKLEQRKALGTIVGNVGDFDTDFYGGHNGHEVRLPNYILRP